MNRRMLLRLASIALLGGTLWAAGNAGYIAVKAELAQVLLQRAWHQSAGGTRPIRPWSWADTWPVAKLSFPDQQQDLLVLGGASGRNLAFGPAHLTRTPWPGDGGHTLIAGHRDTHFARLGELEAGDQIALERAGRRWRYVVTDAGVMHQDRGAELAEGPGESLVLVTCYPFVALDPGTPWRYVVRAAPAT